MTFIKQMGMDYYLCRHFNNKNSKKRTFKPYSDVFLVKSGTSGGYIRFDNKNLISIPMKLIGKRIRLKVEIIEDEDGNRQSKEDTG